MLAIKWIFIEQKLTSRADNQAINYIKCHFKIKVLINMGQKEAKSYKMIPKKKKKSQMDSSLTFLSLKFGEVNLFYLFFT